ncbi:transglutaminase domain-containing protein [Mycoplasmopsis ciconiae]|uniref:Transglutaminase domain-containing protein n=1 Tax=Mycoplasmopsis ciconiae TaxID=561067 RepID=A0ABU7MLK1_9BACT|nr:transglutaminase domain-containing protein [Mycoplasmopsis ciconiae]
MKFKKIKKVLPALALSASLIAATSCAKNDDDLNKQMNDKNQSLDKQNSLLQNQLNDVLSAKEKIVNQVKELKKANDEKIITNQNLAEQLNKMISLKNEEISLVNKQIEDLNNKMTSDQSSLNNNSQMVEVLQTQKNDLDAKINTISLELEEKTKTRDEAKKLVENLRKRIEITKKAQKDPKFIKELEKQMSEANDDLLLKNNELDLMIQNKAQMDQNLKLKSAQIDDLSKQINNLSKNIEDTKNNILKMQENVKNLNEENAHLKSDFNDANSNNIKMNESKINYDSQISKLNDSISKLKNQIQEEKLRKEAEERERLAREQREREEQEKQRQAEEAKKREQEEIRKQQELERQKAEEEKRKAQEQAEKERLAQEERDKEAERERQEKLEREKAAKEEAQRQQELERQRAEQEENERLAREKKEVEEAKKREQEEKLRKEAEEQEKQRQAEEAQRQQELERQKAEEEKRKAQEQAEKERLAKEQKEAEEAKKREQEEKLRKEAEEAQRQQELERQKAEEEKRKAQEQAEKERLAQEEKQREAERQKAAEEAKKQAEQRERNSNQINSENSVLYKDELKKLVDSNGQINFDFVEDANIQKTKEFLSKQLDAVIPIKESVKFNQNEQFFGQGNLLQAVEGRDYFYPENAERKLKNRITKQKTKNREILIRYGNVPLPWKDDKDITIDDLVNMFDIMNYELYSGATFGLRKISSNMVADALLKWMTEKWIDHPYLSGSNGTYRFAVKENNSQISDPISSSVVPDTPENDLNNVGSKIYNNKDYINNREIYVSRIFRGIYINQAFQPGERRKGLETYYKGLFSQIRPGMTDLDKFLAVYKYVISNIAYGGSSNPYSHYFQNGVCADYAAALMEALNILGIPSIFINSGTVANPNVQGPHEVAWVKLNIDGTAKWYSSDSTWNDYGGNATLYEPSWGSNKNSDLAEEYGDEWRIIGTAQFTGRNVSYPTGDKKWKKAFLMSPFDKNDLYKPVDNYYGQQYTNNRFLGLVWTTPIQDEEQLIKEGKKVENYYSKDSWSYIDNSYLSDSNKPKGTDFSNQIFVNGRWLFMNKNSRTSDFQMFSASSSINDTTPKDITNTLPENVKNVLKGNNPTYNDKTFSKPLMFQYYDFVLMMGVQNLQSSDRKVHVFKINNQGFDPSYHKVITLTDANVHYPIHDFSFNKQYTKIEYIKQQTWEDNKALSVDIPQDILNDFKRAISNDAENRKLEIQKFKFFVNTFREGEGANRLTKEVKDNFFKSLENVDVNDFENKYEEFVSDNFATSSKNIYLNLQNPIMWVSDWEMNNYLSFRNFVLGDFSNLFSQNYNSAIFSVYYKRPGDTQFKLLSDKMHDLIVRKKALTEHQINLKQDVEWYYSINVGNDTLRSNTFTTKYNAGDYSKPQDFGKFGFTLEKNKFRPVYFATNRDEYNDEDNYVVAYEAPSDLWSDAKVFFVDEDGVIEQINDLHSRKGYFELKDLNKNGIYVIIYKYQGNYYYSNLIYQIGRDQAIMDVDKFKKAQDIILNKRW